MAYSLLRVSALVALLAVSSGGSAATIAERSVTPVVKASANYGFLNHQGLSRDSCVSTAWQGNTLWTCRDTQIIGQGSIPTYANTASFSILPSATTPAVLNLTSPQGFKIFYPFATDECSSGGVCQDYTRWIGWPDTAPVVTSNNGSAITAWAFIDRQHLDGLKTLDAASYSLYNVTQEVKNGVAMPTAKLYTEYFWLDTEVGYGEAASVVRGGYAYLYGETAGGRLAIARYALSGNMTLADKSRYEYYVNGAWSQGSTPLRNDSSVGLANVASSQGTVYYSNKWSSYVHITSNGSGGPHFNISTAPNPEGPWAAPETFYSGGNFGTGLCYSQVAHPGLTDGTGNYIFLSWTTTNNSDYLQPLVRIDWE